MRCLLLLFHPFPLCVWTGPAVPLPPLSACPSLFSCGLLLRVCRRGGGGGGYRRVALATAPPLHVRTQVWSNSRPGPRLRRGLRRKHITFLDPGPSLCPSFERLPFAEPVAFQTPMQPDGQGKECKQEGRLSRCVRRISPPDRQAYISKQLLRGRIRFF